MAKVHLNTVLPVPARMVWDTTAASTASRNGTRRSPGATSPRRERPLLVALRYTAGAASSSASRARTTMTAATEGHSLPIAMPSATLSVVAVPAPERTPPVVVAPGYTMIDVGTEARELPPHRGVRALSDADHRDQSRDADDDAERRQAGAGEVPARARRGRSARSCGRASRGAPAPAPSSGFRRRRAGRRA